VVLSNFHDFWTSILVKLNRSVVRPESFATIAHLAGKSGDESSASRTPGAGFSF
jgi:hypothetical protein